MAVVFYSSLQPVIESNREQLFNLFFFSIDVEGIFEHVEMSGFGCQIDNHYTGGI